MLLMGVVAAIAILAVVALTVGSGLGSSTRFSPTPGELISRDATVQAQVALEQFFNALGSGDSALANSFMVSSGNGPTDWNVDRLEVESITPVSYPQSSDDAATGSSQPEERTFEAPVRMWPGDGSTTAGERLGWTWTLQRGSDGKWRLANWGAG